MAMSNLEFNVQHATQSFKLYVTPFKKYTCVLSVTVIDLRSTMTIGLMDVVI